MRLGFQQPMPFSRGLQKEILYICISGAATFVLFNISPFGFRQIGWLNLLGFSLISVLAGIVYLIFTHYLYEKYWSNRPWTLGWEIIHSLCFLIFIGICILLYGYLIHLTNLTLKDFFLYLFYTAVLGLIPVTIRAMLVRNWRLKNELAEAQKMNELLAFGLAKRKLATDEKIIELQDLSSKDTIEFSTQDLLYIEAAENYITVVWEDDHAIKKAMIRMTMKAAIKQIDDPLIVFCHRSFIVNLRRVRSIANSGGVSEIMLNGVERGVPMSRGNREEIRKRLGEF